MSVGVAMVWQIYKITALLNFLLTNSGRSCLSDAHFWGFVLGMSLSNINRQTLTDIVDAFLCVAEMAQPTMLLGWIFKHIGTCRLSLLS
jgi:hypothetical protein